MKTQYVMFAKGIDPDSVNELIGTVYTLSNDSDEVYIFFNSNGGDVNAGIYCYNMLRSLPVVLTTHNVGNVDSIANVIFLAGEKRYVSPSAAFMFHSVYHQAQAGTSLDEKLLRETLNSVITDHKRIGSIFASRTSVTLEESDALFREQRNKAPAWAIEKEFAHEIRLPETPPGVFLHQLT